MKGFAIMISHDIHSRKRRLSPQKRWTLGCFCFCLILALLYAFPVVAVNTGLSTSAASDYQYLCDRWLSSGGTKETLLQTVSDFKEFARANANSSYYARAYFNLGQIAADNPALFGDPRLYYAETLDACLLGKVEWKGSEATVGNEYGGLACLRLATLEFESGNTTDCLMYIDMLYAEYGNVSHSGLLLRELVGRSSLRPELIPQLKAVTDKVLQRDSRSDKREIYGDAMEAYLLMAEHETATVAECRALSDKMAQFATSPIPTARERILQRHLTSLEDRRIQAAIKPLRIQDLPRFSTETQR